MIDKNNLMQKHGLMIITLSRYFLEKEIGDRICTIKEMSEKYNMARGTIQNALKILQENNFITLEARGHLGTFIRSMNFSKLLDSSGIGNVICVMPLPYTKKYEGIATGLYNEINKVISFNLAFMRGSENRMKFLYEGRYDLAIVSKLTAIHHIKNGANINIIASLGKDTYVSGHDLIVKNDFKELFDGMRVGIDTSSFDQSYLTKLYFKDKNVEFININYSNITEHLKSNYIDAAIFSVDEILTKEDMLKIIKLDCYDPNMLDRETVLIANKENKSIKNLISRFLDINKVLEIQKKVVSKEITPNY